MLRAAIESCPESLWTEDAARNPFWRVAYHTIFYTHLYLCASQEAFEPWENAREEIQFMGPVPWPPHHTVDPGEPYSREELLAYHDLVTGRAAALIEATALDGPSGFEWIPFSRMELMLYNLRHVQHHAGQLIDRVGAVTGEGVAWTGFGSSPTTE